MGSKIFLCIVTCVLTWITGALSQCAAGEALTFARWAGAEPAAAPVFVYSARGDERSLSGACVARCRELAACGGVAVAFGRALCHGLAAGAAWAAGAGGGAGGDRVRLDSDVSYFQKVCLKVPTECSGRWWALEVTPGYHLSSAPALLLQNTTLEECYSAVLTGDGRQIYRSAQWIDSADNEVSAGAAAGACALSAADRVTEPESYRVANYRTFYVENQCRHDYSKKIERCSYEEYFNQTLRHVDLTLADSTRDECRSACESEERFVCRGFSWSRAPGRDPQGTLGWDPQGPQDWDPQEAPARGLCDLHSEDLVSTGSWLLRRTTDASYYRRVICLNISVDCNSTHLSVTYTPRTAFHGLLYVPGAGGAGGAAGPCGAEGRGGPVTLELPLHGDCEVSFAYALGQGPDGLVNRTLAHVVLSVQQHRVVQTAGDRWVRAGCTARRPLAVAAAVADRPGSGGGGVSAVFAPGPAATLALLRAPDAPGAAPALGETLELRIETQEENEIEAYHAVAASRLGDSSVLLLDHRGCPTGQVDFPQFTRSRSGGTQRLSARFKAFRFPASPLVRFTVLVRACDGRCPPVTCQPTPRAARNTNATDCAPGVTATPEVTVTPGVGALPGGQALQLELLVTAQDVMSADTLVRADHREPLAPADGPEPGAADGAAWGAEGAGDAALVCVHELVAVALALGWLAVQALLAVGGAVLLKRYRALAELSHQKEYQAWEPSAAEPGATHRRVHWPDEH